MKSTAVKERYNGRALRMNELLEKYAVAKAKRIEIPPLKPGLYP